MLARRVEALYLLDTALLRDVENRQKESSAALHQILENELAIFRGRAVSAYYWIIAECATNHGISLHEAAERYKLARKAALFSRLRQQENVFRLLRGKLVEEVENRCKYTKASVKSVTIRENRAESSLLEFSNPREFKLTQERDEIALLHYEARIRLNSWKALRLQYLISLQSRKKKLVAQQEAAQRFLEVRNRRLLFKSFTILVKVYSAKNFKNSLLKRNYQRMEYRHSKRLLRAVFGWWLRVSLDKRLVEAMAAAMLIRINKMTLQRAFRALYVKYSDTRRLGYPINFKLSLRQTRLASAVFTSFRSKIWVSECKADLLKRIEEIRIESEMFSEIKSVIALHGRIRTLIGNSERGLERCTFSALIAAKQAPNFLSARERSFKHILEIRLQIRLFRFLRSCNIGREKARIMKYRFNETLIRSAFEGLRESAWLVRLNRISRMQWKRRRGVFQPASGKTSDVLKMCFNQMFKVANVRADRLFEQSAMSANRNPDGLAQFPVEEREGATLCEAFAAWTTFVQEMRLRNLRLLEIEEKQDSYLRHWAFLALLTAYTAARNEIDTVQHELQHCLTKAFRMFRQAYLAREIGAIFMEADSKRIISTIFVEWAELVPYAEILQRVKFELQLEGVSPSGLSLVEELPIRAELDILRQQYAYKLGPELLGFIDMGCELLDAAEHLPRVNINKYCHQLFRIAELQHFGERWTSFCNFTAIRCAKRALANMRLRLMALHANEIVAREMTEQRLSDSAFTIWSQSSNMLELADGFRFLFLRKRTFRIWRMTTQRSINYKAAEVFNRHMLASHAFVSVQLKQRQNASKRNMKRLAETWHYKKVTNRILQKWRLETNINVDHQNAERFSADSLMIKAFNCMIQRHNSHLEANDELQKIIAFEAENLRKLAFEGIIEAAHEVNSFEEKEERLEDLQNDELVARCFNNIRRNYDEEIRMKKMQEIATQFLDLKEKRLVMKILKLALTVRAMQYARQSRLMMTAFNVWRELLQEHRLEFQQEGHALRYHEHFCKNKVFEHWKSRALDLLCEERNGLIASEHYNETILLGSIKGWRQRLRILLGIGHRIVVVVDRRVLRAAWQSLMLKYVILRTAEEQIEQRCCDSLAAKTLSTLIHETDFAVASNKQQIERTLKCRVFKRISIYRRAMISAELEIEQKHTQNVCYLMLRNLSLLLRKFQLRNKLADDHYRASLKRRVFSGCHIAFQRLGFYSYNPAERVRRALAEWKRIARENAVSRHLEVRAERFERKRVLSKIFLQWKAYCHITEYEDSW